MLLSEVNHDHGPMNCTMWTCSKQLITFIMGHDNALYKSAVTLIVLD